jgi:hypothetical protein
VQRFLLHAKMQNPNIHDPVYWYSKSQNQLKWFNAFMLVRVNPNIWISQILHCKKSLKIFPSPAGMSLTSLVSDLPTGDGKIANLFLQWYWPHQYPHHTSDTAPTTLSPANVVRNNYRYKHCNSPGFNPIEHLSTQWILRGGTWSSAE